MKLDGNTTLITGGSSGIGFELANRLIQLGSTVIITGRDQSKLDAAKKKLPQVHTIQSDVSDPQAITALHNQVVGQFPQLNVLINNAGIMRRINLHDSGSDLMDITQETETNLNGPIRMVKQFLPHLKKQSSAAIMNVTSGLAFVPLPLSPIYCAAKAGLHSYTQSLRVQLRNTNVKVFELAPPLTQTTLLDSFEAEDMKGSKAMDVVEMVGQAIKGLQQDRYEIRPGQSNTLHMMSRVAPQFILNQLSKSTDSMINAK
ncbi:oxidoreductase [Paenibacillus sp. CCS19]|uniref:SDR family oxidoreductase n=1 Tax=Paenibacillus sp. CCS19 TaxID=3158387 RepID=UPI002561DEBD|nr:SDR family NAD(P)-dependent oxidoreductase [Paenibacillus cellulosilyticus]GMK40618.1 oxidoreductase [Paenibacillus cellulosilyticus]